MRPAIDALAAVVSRADVFAVRRAGRRLAVRSRRGVSIAIAAQVMPRSTSGASPARSSAASRSAAWSRSGLPRAHPDRAVGADPGLDAGTGLAPQADSTSSTRGCRGCSGRCSWPNRRSGCAAKCARRFRTKRDRRRFRRGQLAHVARARRLAVADGAARAADRSHGPVSRDCAACRRPTLIVHGEPHSTTSSMSDGTLEYAA